MKPWATTFYLLSSPLTGRPGMSTLERFSAATVKLLFLGGAAAWAVMGLYFYKFAPGSWFELSADDQRWNNFGTFVGGMLGPFFGFLAFIGVVFTVVLQARQIDEMRERADLEEIQRVLASLSTRIDSWLQEAPRGHTELFKLIGSPHSLYELLATMSRVSFGRAGLDCGHASFMVDEAKATELFDAAQRELRQLRVDLDSLAWSLERFIAEGGSRSVLELYRYRYDLITCWLLAIGAPTTPAMEASFRSTEGLKDIIAGLKAAPSGKSPV